MGCLSTIQSKILPLHISNSTKEEILEGVELFIGGSFTALASSWLTNLLSIPALKLKEVVIKALTGGIAPLIFVLLTHLLHMLFAKGKGHDHSDDENIERGTGASLSGGGNPQPQGGSMLGGANPQPQGGCCFGCSVAYCQALRQRKNRKKNAQKSESEEVLMQPEDEGFLKDSMGQQTTKPQPWECAFGMCSEISPSNEGPIFPALDTVSKAKSTTKIRAHRLKPKQQRNSLADNLDKNGRDYNQLSQENINTQKDQVSNTLANRQEDPALMGSLSAEKISAAVAEDVSIIEALNSGNAVPI
jgi:hypothetical protein